MLIFSTPAELIEALEEKAQAARDGQGKTRTKIETNELKGKEMAFNEAIYYVKALAKGLETGYKGPNNHGKATEVESVA